MHEGTCAYAFLNLTLLLLITVYVLSEVTVLYVG